MQSLNQDNSTEYDSEMAVEFFQLFGKWESIKPGETIFAQGQKPGFFSLQSEKMYLLVEGTVNIQTAHGLVCTLEEGDLFGEFTLITSRTRTAVAASDCKLIALNEKQLLTALKANASFAWMLISVLVNSLRKPDPEAKNLQSFAKIKSAEKNGVIDAKMLKELVKKAHHDSIMAVPMKRVLFKEGSSAMLMYVILEGEVTTTVNGKEVGRSSAGAVIGEIALVDQKTRTATVIAETHCSLLSFNRQQLLDLIQSFPEFGVALLRVLSSRLCLGNQIAKPKKDSDNPEDWDW